jgi:3-oxoadipate enol-lactonase
MPFAHTDDCAVYYEVRGDSGTPLLLIAGYGASLATWSAEQVAQLADNHRVIMFDNRGVGNSGKPNRPYAMDDFVRDALAVMDVTGVETAHVMGASMGGMIAQNFALRWPDRVRSLILACTVPAGPLSEKIISPSPVVLATLLAPRTDDKAQDIRNLWPILYSERFIAERREWLEELLEEKLGYPPPPQFALENQMHAVAETHDVLDRLCDIEEPTLVLTGSDDVLIPPQNSRIIAERIPNARLIEYAGAGHGFLDEAAEPALADILNFLEQVDASAA